MTVQRQYYIDRYATNHPSTRQEVAYPNDYETGIEWDGGEEFDLQSDSDDFQNLSRGNQGERASDQALLEEMNEGVLEDSTPPEEIENEAPSPEELESFRQEVREAEEEFKEFVESKENLSETEKESLIQAFQEKTRLLPGINNLEAAGQELTKLSAEARGEVETASTAAQESRDARRRELFDTVTRATQEPKFREASGHWHHVGWSLGEKFDTALQSGDWTEFNLAVQGLRDGDQRFVPIMRLVSAIFRTAGNEAKATEMINNFIPKDVISTLISKVTEAADNLNWMGQGWPDNETQVGADQWHLWTPSGTAAFLRRTLAERRTHDPYAPMTES